MGNKYKNYFDELYAEVKTYSECDSRLEFLGSNIFDFDTDDSTVDELFATKMIEVIECIVNKTTFVYQENQENYINYLTMVNMPFLKDKLDCGTSIRGAWFDEYEMSTYLKIPKSDILQYMQQLIEWAKDNNEK